MIHRYPISSILSLKFHKKPKLCDNASHLTWKDSRVFLQCEAQRITKLLPRTGKHPHTSQISSATAFVQRNARESLQFANLNRDPLNIYAHVYFVERGEIPFAREEVEQTSARRTKPEKFRCSFKPQHKNPTVFQSWNLPPAHLREPESRPKLGDSSRTPQTWVRPRCFACKRERKFPFIYKLRGRRNFWNQVWPAKMLPVVQRPCLLSHKCIFKGIEFKSCTV